MDPEILDGASVLPYLASEHVASINGLPTVFGQLIADGLFPAEGLDTVYVEIFVENGVIRALPVTEGGRPSTIARHDKGKSFIFKIPNVSHEDSILADTIRGWLALARRSRQPEVTLAEKVEKQHLRNRLKFDMTREVMSMGALRGRIVDGDNTLLYDLYDVFGLEEKVVYFDLDSAETDVKAKIEEVYGYVEDNLTDETMSGVEARVSPEFFDKLLGHPNFQKYYLNTPAALQLLTQARQQVAGTYRRTFNAGGLELKEYRAKFTSWSGVSSRLIEAGEGHAYPTGTLDTHHTWCAPPIDIRELTGGDANVSDLIHMTTEPMKHGAGEEWKYQMNALPIWSRPKLLVKLSAEADPG